MSAVNFLAGSKFGTVGAFASIGGAVWASVITPDSLPVIGGIGLGIAGLGWSIYLSGRDRRVATLTEEIELLQSIVKNVRLDLKAADEIVKGLGIENVKLATKLAIAEAKDDPHEK